MHRSRLSDVSSGYDVVVIGAGAAGMSAALFSAIRGAKTLLVEKTGFVGGTSALSAGSIWIPNTRHASDAAAADTSAKAERYLQQIVGNRSDAALRHAFLQAGLEAIEVLENHSEVKLRAYARHPDYRSELEGAVVAGRALEPLAFDGRLLGEAFSLVRPPLPEFTLLGGMMVDRTDIGHLLTATTSLKSLFHSAGLLARHGRDRLRYSRGSRLVMGNALIGRLLYSLIGRDVDILLETSLQNIVRDAGGRVISAPHSGRRHRSGVAATDPMRFSRISCSTGPNRGRWSWTRAAAASSTKRSPTMNSRWRCLRTERRRSRRFLWQMRWLCGNTDWAWYARGVG